MILPKIEVDFTKAWKAGEIEKKNFLGLVKAEIKKAEEKVGAEPFTEEREIAVLRGLAKSLETTIGSGGDSDIVKESERQLEYLQVYLPEMMGEKQIETIVTGLINSGAKNIGDVMKEFNAKYKGKADNKLVKQVALDTFAALKEQA